MSKHWPAPGEAVSQGFEKPISENISPLCLADAAMMSLCLVADGVINNKDHSWPRQSREERIDQLSSHKSNQKREHGRLGAVSLDSFYNPNINLFSMKGWPPLASVYRIQGASASNGQHSDILTVITQNRASKKRIIVCVCDNENKPDMLIFRCRELVPHSHCGPV